MPTKAPGTIFESLTGGDSTLNIRWITPLDPVFYEVMNRPMADLAVRQLVIAKAVDNLQVRLGHQSQFPFIVQPRVSSGTIQQDIPVGLIWDMHASLPTKWENLRLAKIKRMSGENSNTNGYDGILRLIFTANIQNNITETAIFYVDYQINSLLTYQSLRLNVVTSAEENVPINPGESETVGGFIIFKTLNLGETGVQDFYDLLAPGADTDVTSDGLYDNPAVYDIVDNVAGGTAITDDFSASVISHGTGLLTDSAWNAIPQLDSDIQSWLMSFNYPFDAVANRTSTDNIQIPNGLFREFNITSPAGDNPTGDISGTYYPVWINRILRDDSTADHLTFYFATYNITDGSPSTTPIEFAYMDLYRDDEESKVVPIKPISNLLLRLGVDEQQYNQHFGRGHVVLSSLWNNITSEIDDFFDAFSNITVNPADTEFTKESTRLSSFAISRVPKYSPTKGQSSALVGSTGRLSNPIPPSDSNRYVCERDQGLGNTVDLNSQPGITSHVAIDRYGYTGSLVRKSVKLVIDATEVGEDASFYDTQILPRLRILLGRDPIFGDEYYNGTRFMRFNGDSWQG